MTGTPPSTALIQEQLYTSTPSSLITRAGLDHHGWTQTQSGWLLQSDTPVTTTERSSVRELAATAGLAAEFRDNQAELGTIRTAATTIGLLLALGVLALTIGLLRAETTNELRTLTATGATSTFRRSLGAATAGSLALTGVLLGTLTAYMGLAAGYATDLNSLRPIPVLHLGLMLIGVPTVAALSSWLLAGREPSTLRRSAIE